MKIFRLELRKSPFIVAAPAIYVVATVFAVSSAYPTLASWTNVTFALFTAQSFVAPLVAGVAAWSGLRSMRRRLAAAEATSIRSSAMIRTPQIAADISLVLAASLALLFALILRGLVIGMTGFPVVASLLYGVLVPMLFVLTGYVVSMIIPHWIAIPVAVSVPLALYAANTFGVGNAAILALNPLYRFANNDPWMPAAVFYAGQLLVAIGYSILLAFIVTVIGRSRVWLGTVLTGLAVLPLLVVGFTLLNLQSANAIIAEKPHSLVVTNSESGLTIEVLDLYKPVANELSATWGRIAELTADSELQFSTLRQDFDPTYDPQESPGKFYRLDLNPNSTSISSTSVETAFNDVASCALSGRAADSDWWLEGTLVVRTWFQGEATFPSNVYAADPGMQSALDTLNGLSLSDGNSWVKAHAEKFKSCAWSRADFPQS